MGQNNKMEVPTSGDKEDDLHKEVNKFRDIGTDFNFKHEYIIPVVIVHVIVQATAIYGLYLSFTEAKILTSLWSYYISIVAGTGVTLGAHRLFSHKSFKATKLLKLFLIIAHSMAGQNHILWWARDHRLHHKFSDTDADPYNATRGFFFSHMKWLMVKRHPMVAEKGKLIDISDLKADPFVMFQRKYIIPMHIFFAFLFPVMVPVYFWNESFWTSFFVTYCLRIDLTLHSTWSVNSFAHLWGTKPIDRRINPVQSKFVDFVTYGEGWHNYHHCFPWDCGMSEFGYQKGITTRVLEAWELVGLAYDLKKASVDLIQSYGQKYGDGSIQFEK